MVTHVAVRVSVQRKRFNFTCLSLKHSRKVRIVKDASKHAMRSYIPSNWLSKKPEATSIESSLMCYYVNSYENIMFESGVPTVQLKLIQ